MKLRKRMGHGRSFLKGPEKSEPASIWESRAVVSDSGRREAFGWSLLTHAGTSRCMLQAMQQPASNQPSPTLSDFAGLLATIASPPPDTTEDEPLWSSSDLGEDVAALSYEQALRARARYRSAYRSDGSPMPSDGLGFGAGADSAHECVAAGTVPAQQSFVATDRDLRSASVTIRLNKAECARMHQRAAEAGLTVSAYLRSCALEAEALRAQVKQALAEIKAESKGAREQRSKGARERGSKNTGWRMTFNWIALFKRMGL